MNVWTSLCNAVAFGCPSRRGHWEIFVVSRKLASCSLLVDGLYSYPLACYDARLAHTGTAGSPTRLAINDLCCGQIIKLHLNCLSRRMALLSLVPLHFVIFFLPLHCNKDTKHYALPLVAALSKSNPASWTATRFLD
jgi:hypothetical protein